MALHPLRHVTKIYLEQQLNWIALNYKLFLASMNKFTLYKSFEYIKN